MRILLSVALGTACFNLTGCQQRMGEQGHVRPFAPSEFFQDGASARPPVPGTVARDQRLGPVPAKNPLKLDLNLLKKGQTRFEAFCTPCHGFTGNGRGMIVQRGLSQPPSFHEERLRNVQDSHIYNVITNGYGAMYSYANRVAYDDRWAIIAYIRALQLSQNAEVSSLSDEERKELGGGP